MASNMLERKEAMVRKRDMVDLLRNTRHVQLASQTPKEVPENVLLSSHLVGRQMEPALSLALSARTSSR